MPTNTFRPPVPYTGFTTNGNLMLSLLSMDDISDSVIPLNNTGCGTGILCSNNFIEHNPQNMNSIYTFIASLMDCF